MQARAAPCSLRKAREKWRVGFVADWSNLRSLNSDWREHFAKMSRFAYAKILGDLIIPCSVREKFSVFHLLCYQVASFSSQGSKFCPSQVHKGWASSRLLVTSRETTDDSPKHMPFNRDAWRLEVSLTEFYVNITCILQDEKKRYILGRTSWNKPWWMGRKGWVGSRYTNVYFSFNMFFYLFCSFA